MPKIFFRIPADDVLESPAAWRRLGDNTFAATQADCVIVQTREKVQRGPPIKAIDVPGGTEYSIQDKRASLVKHAGEIQHTVQTTVTSKFASEAAAKIAAEMGVTGIVPSARFSQEMQLKASLELSEAVQDTLAQKRSFEVQDSQEITRSISYKPVTAGAARVPTRLQFYLNLWPWRWEFYLYRVRYLSLRYEKNWFWPNVRKTMLPWTIEPRSPMFMVRVYEPQDEYSWTDQDYDPDVTDDDLEEIKLQPLTRSLPDIRIPASPTLEDLAKLAFPVTREERQRVTATRRAKKAAAKKPAKKAAGKSAKKAIKRKGARSAVKRSKKATPAKMPRSAAKRVAKRKR